MIALVPVYDDTRFMGFDIAIAEEGGDLQSDKGMETAIILSLYCDAPAQEGDDVDSDLINGAWFDALSDDGDVWGSRLWLLRRSKTTPEVLRDAKAYTEEALEWMVDDGVARSVTATAERVGMDHLKITTDIVRPDGGRFQRVWDYQLRSV